MEEEVVVVEEVVEEVQLFSLQEVVVVEEEVVEVGTSQGRNIHHVLRMVEADNHL